MALGGVATGSINAQLAARATGIATCALSKPIPIATPNIIGTKVAVVAWLLVSSVRNTTITTTRSIKRIGLISLKVVKKLPIQSPKPVFLICPAIERPPPNRISTPQGRFFVTFHSIKPPPFEDLAIKSDKAESIAIP